MILRETTVLRGKSHLAGDAVLAVELAADHAFHHASSKTLFRRLLYTRAAGLGPADDQTPRLPQFPFEESSGCLPSNQRAQGNFFVEMLRYALQDTRIGQRQ
jgi:hypothetical protein